MFHWFCCNHLTNDQSASSEVIGILHIFQYLLTGCIVDSTTAIMAEADGFDLMTTCSVCREEYEENDDDHTPR